MPTASEYAADVASVRDDPAGRLALMHSLYEAEPGRPELHLPYRRAALGFMGWQLRRGLLNAMCPVTPCAGQASRRAQREGHPTPLPPDGARPRGCIGPNPTGRNSYPAVPPWG